MNTPNLPLGTPLVHVKTMSGRLEGSRSTGEYVGRGNVTIIGIVWREKGG